jgi:hypothetical protein
MHLYVIRECGPKRPDETADEYTRRVLEDATRPDRDTLDRLVALLRSGDVEEGQQ